MEFKVNEDIVSINNLNFSGITISNFKKELNLLIEEKFEILGVSEDCITIRFFEKDEITKSFLYEIRKKIETVFSRYEKNTISPCRKFIIIPTGDEILKGLVVDQNSPIIAGMIIKAIPGSTIFRTKPASDNKEHILSIIRQNLSKKPDYIIITGGTGGGKKFSDQLSKDLVHDVLKENFQDIHYRNIFGQNGHLFSTLTIANSENTKILSLPGPKDECTSLFRLFLKNMNLSDEVIIDILRDYLIEIHESKYHLDKRRVFTEEELTSLILKYREMGMGARQIARELNKMGSSLKFYQVQYRLNKLLDKI